MEYPGSHEGGDDQGTSESSWESEVPVYGPALALLQQAAAWAYPDELNRLADAVEEAADDDAGREQVTEHLASWSRLPNEILQQILYHLPDTDPREVASVSRDMAAFFQAAYEQQEAHAARRHDYVVEQLEREAKEQQESVQQQLRLKPVKQQKWVDRQQAEEDRWRDPDREQ